ncbi:MAG: hypothetical protein K6L81_12820 [Agarilytica sp.]
MNLKAWTVLVLMLVAAKASSMTVDFDLLDPISADGKRGAYADSYNYQSEGLGLEVSAWSNGGNRYSPFSTISEASVGMNRNGLGVERRGGVRGNVDNLGMDFDFLMLEFDSEVTLSSVGVGFIPKYADSDISLGGIDEFGVWSVGNIYDAELGANATNATFTSSTWLIGAFHPLFGITQDFSWDAFRIDQISVNVSAVPLPAAFWFFASGLFVIGYFRRKSNA